MKKIVTMSLIVLAVLVTQQMAMAEKNLSFLFNFSTNILDPATDKRYIPLRAGILETISRVDNNSLEVLPWLAESWKSQDAVNWEFKIRPGIQFSDGSPCDAKAVQDSIERLIEKNRGLKNTLKIASMDSNGQILKIVTSEVHPALPSDLGHPQTAILKANAPNPDTQPIGTGPFVVKNFRPHAAIELVKNKNYWNGDVHLDKAQFVMNEDANSRLLSLQSGQADVIFKPAIESLQMISAMPDLNVDAVKGIRVHNIIYNTALLL